MNPSAGAPIGSFLRAVRPVSFPPSLPPSAALSRQLEPVGGKTLLVVPALWERGATTSITEDSGLAAGIQPAEQLCILAAALVRAEMKP